MSTPPYLNEGDTVAIVSTARKIEPEVLEPAISILESWGLKIRIGATIGASKDQFAGSDQERIDDLQKAINDPEVKAIICARGGYGTVRIVDHIDLSIFAERPKWIVGYSDVTVLHAHLAQVHGTTSIHSTMPVNFKENSDDALATLKAALFGEPLVLHGAAHVFNRTGEAVGEVVGGNLSILYSLMGSRSELDPGGKILVLEDLDEYLYHVDRMMQNLDRAGKLHELAGLIVGGMTDMNDNDIPFGKTAEEIIREIVAKYEYPVCYGFPVGHIDDNRAFYHHKKASLSVGDSVRLAFE